MGNVKTLVEQIQQIVKTYVDKVLKNYPRIVSARVISITDKLAVVRMPYAEDSSSDFNAYVVTSQLVSAGDVVNVAYWANLSTAVVLSNTSTQAAAGGGGGGTTDDYNGLSNKPSINSTTLSGNKTSADLGLYGTENQPPYPVKSVNSKTGDVSLTAGDVGALPDTTTIPSKTSDLTNDSGYITSADAPVQSVDGMVGAVTTNAVKTTTQTLTEAQKTQARANIGAGTSDFDGNYNSLDDKPTIPTKNSQLENDSDFATESQVNAKYTKPADGIPESDLAQDVQDSLAKANSALQSAPVTSVNGKTGAVSLTAGDVGALPDTTQIPTKTSDLTNDSGFVDSAGAAEAAPVKSVNAKTGVVVLSASDIGAVSTGDVTQTLGNSTTKVPSEKAVSDALSGAGAGDMMKSAYDPTGAVEEAGGIPDYVDAKIPTIPTNLVKYVSLTEVQATTPVNADTLQGHAANYFASASDLGTLSGKVATNTTDISNHEAELININDELLLINDEMTGKLDVAGGKMFGALIAQTNTNYTTAQVRNVIISPDDPDDSIGNNGDIWLKYSE